MTFSDFLTATAAANAAQLALDGLDQLVNGLAGTPVTP